MTLPAAHLTATASYRHEGCQIDPETCASEGRLGESYTQTLDRTGPFEAFGSSYTARSYYGAEGTAIVDHYPTPEPIVIVQAQAFTGSEDPDELSFASVEATLTYGFALSGPDGAVPVSIRAFAQLRENLGGTQSSRGFARVEDQSGALVFSFDTTVDYLAYAFTTPSPFGYTAFYEGERIDTVQLQANSLYTVVLNAYAEASQQGLNGASYGMAWVDPTFADAARYTVQLSPGVGNGATSATPEPSAWALMILGFGGMGAALRRRRPRSA